MRKYVSILVLALCVVAFAQYEELWYQDEVGLPQNIHVLGIENTDADPQLELVYCGDEPEKQNDRYILALDLLTGEVTEVVEEFYYIYTDPGKAPRLVDVDQNGRYEILFLGQEDDGEDVGWYLYGCSPGGMADRGGKRLRGPRLRQNIPNPLKREAKIEYEVPSRGDISIKIYDASGRLVRTLEQGEVDAGQHSVVWRRDDADGKPVPTGTYFYVLESAGHSISRKAVVAE